MPELPEVEIARRNLTRWLAGATVVTARTPDRTVAPRGLARLAGAHVTRVVRRGKWLRLELEGGLSLFSHLGMTGKWVRRRADEPAVRWERARVDVRRQERVISARYVDPRRFGRLLVARGEIPAWRAMGPDPLVDGIEVTKLHESLSRRRRAVKEALMDPAVIAGVGNIQATEALWKARVDPRARADTLRRAEVNAIARGLRWTIDRTLAVSSGPEIAYVQEAGSENPFCVYGRSGEPCPRCKTTLVRSSVGGRTTVYCPRCQPRR